jgi:glycosyltransferase involved in cell wall biosynthesis
LDQIANETIRVLQIDTGREWRGSQQQVLYLSRALVARGHKSILVTPKKSALAERAQAEDLPVREISYRGSVDPIAIGAVFQAVQDVRANIIHTHTAHAHSLGFLARRLPTRTKEQRPALVIHRRVDLPPSADPLTRMRYTSDPFMTYLCVSEAIRGTLERYGIARGRLRVVRSCIDTARIDEYADEDPDELKKELGLGPESHVIGAVGELAPQKGHRYLIDAMPRIVTTCPNAHLVLFGDGPQEADLRRQCWQQNVQSHVTFAGFRDDVERFYHCFHLFVHPSTEEGLGTTILDAMAARLPVVAARAGGIPEIVRHGETGWLVPPAAPTELAGPVISLLEDPRRRLQFGGAGRARVEAEFSVAKLCNETLSAYQDALVARTSPPCGESQGNPQKA